MTNSKKQNEETTIDPNSIDLEKAKEFLKK